MEWDKQHGSRGRVTLWRMGDDVGRRRSRASRIGVPKPELGNEREDSSRRGLPPSNGVQNQTRMPKTTYTARPTPPSATPQQVSSSEKRARIAVIHQKWTCPFSRRLPLFPPIQVAVRQQAVGREQQASTTLFWHSVREGSIVPEQGCAGSGLQD